MRESALSKAKEDAVWPREGGKFRAAFEEGWDAALDLLAQEIEGRGCQRDELENSRFAANVSAGWAPHHALCPVAMAAKIRGDQK